MARKGIVGTIAAAWRQPIAAARDEVTAPPPEPAILIRLFFLGVATFITDLPEAIAQASTMEADDAQVAVFTARIFGLIFVFPLLVYVLAFVTWSAMQVTGAKAPARAHRAALSWALLAALPLALLASGIGALTAGMVVFLTDLAALGAFLWFWALGLRAIAQDRPDAPLSPHSDA